MNKAKLMKLRDIALNVLLYIFLAICVIDRGIKQKIQILLHLLLCQRNLAVIGFFYLLCRRCRLIKRSYAVDGIAVENDKQDQKHA